MKNYNFDIIPNKQTPKAESVDLKLDKNLIEAFAEYVSKLDNCAGLAANQTSLISLDEELLSVHDDVYIQTALDPVKAIFENLDLPNNIKEFPNPLKRVRNNKAFFVICSNKQYPQMVFINPKIIKVYENKTFCSEGCLTWHGKKIRAFRHDMIDTEYTNLEGKLIKRTFDGFQAQVFQHEYNHIAGIPEHFEGEKKIGRNEPCPCNSGRKWKHCCLNK